MSLANIKIESERLEKLKTITGEQTAQKAVDKALEYVFREAKQRSILDVIRSISFVKGFDPSKERKRER